MSSLIRTGAVGSSAGGSFRLRDLSALTRFVCTIFVKNYLSFAYSDSAAMRTGMSGSASFQTVRKS